MEKNTFKKDLEFGQFKEEVVMNVLEIGYEIKSTQDNDTNTHDLILDNGCTIEVKTDRFLSSTKNILLELYSNEETKKEGWLQYSTSDILAICVDNNDDIQYTTSVIFIDYKAMRESIKRDYFNGDFNYIDDFFELKLHQRGKALNILIPIERIKKHVICIYSKEKHKETYQRERLQDFYQHCVPA